MSPEIGFVVVARQAGCMLSFKLLGDEVEARVF